MTSPSLSSSSLFRHAAVGVSAFCVGVALTRWFSWAAAPTEAKVDVGKRPRGRRRRGDQQQKGAGSQEPEPPAAAAAARESVGSSKGKPGSSVLSFTPIGVIESCFPTTRGAPRQGFFVPASRGRLVLRRGQGCMPACCLSNVGEYSHVWVVFVFHANEVMRGNKIAPGKGGKAAPAQTPKGKIQPPKLGLGKVGLYSTRSPHRPNAIGLSIAKIESVDDRRGVLELSGIDLIEGTPVLDIKPYVPAYDANSEARMAEWVCESSEASHIAVAFTDQARAQLEDVVTTKNVRFYHGDASGLETLITQTLRLNIDSGSTHARAGSKRQQSKHETTTGEETPNEGMTGGSSGTVSRVLIDGANVSYTSVQLQDAVGDEYTKLDEKTGYAIEDTIWVLAVEKAGGQDEKKAKKKKKKQKKQDTREHQGTSAEGRETEGQTRNGTHHPS